MNKEILERFFNNEASEAEVEEVLKWFEDRQLNPQKSQSLEELWHEIGASDYVSHDGDQLLHDIHQDIRRSEVSHRDKRLYRYNRTSRRRDYGFPMWAKAAAVLVVAVGLFAFWSVNNSHTGNSVGENREVTKIAEPGEKKTLTLSDGTVIQLNADSRITFPEKFSKTEREVFLTGEAFFEVTEDSSRRFVVHTGELTATVLGTSFNIRNYPEDKQTDVSLASGKLKVESGDNRSRLKSHVLNPGEAAVLDKRDSTLTKGRFDPELSLGWTRGMLVFRDADVDELITRIERWYGVTVKVKNREELARQKWRYRGVFRDEPLRNVLEGISYVKDFTYEVENQIVNITF
ncbi:FecR family protein [Fodinibius roseus]|uniref:FecR family protein n=1 Tax=Fodinibius roseus TaxID=1194090 RepID=A0A1M5FWT0_9BACT|nr:FecR domain-containing protein [Fodinibius roseus]SHF95958.1 FecR family protein [Fodinibius roseus]